MLVFPCYNSVLQKHIKFERMSGWNYSFIIEKGNSSNGSMQLNLWINSVPLEKGMAASVCLKETQYPWNTRSLQVAIWNDDGTT